MWAKIDDQFYMSVKNSLMDRDEQDLYLAALVYCNSQLTDGYIPANKLPIICTWAKLPDEANAKAIASRLVEHGFMELVDNGYMIHDFLDWNPSRQEVLELREARSEAGKRGGLKSGAARRASSEAIAKASAEAKRQAKPKQNRTPSPYHINSSSKEEESSPAPQTPTPHQQLVGALADVCMLNLKLKASLIGKTATELLNAGYTADDVKMFGAWWQADDWRAEHTPIPTLNNVKDKIDQSKNGVTARSNLNGTTANRNGSGKPSRQPAFDASKYDADAELARI